VDQAAFLEIMRRMAEQDAQQGTHPPAQNNPLTFLQGLDQVQQQSLRPAAYWAARARGDEGTQQSIMGGGRYEPGMITGSELGDFPAQILLDSTNIIPGMGLPTPAQLGALAMVLPRAGTAAARRMTQVLSGAARNSDDLFRGLVNAGVNENLARLPGVQTMYNRALNMADDGIDLTRHVDGLSPQRYIQATAANADEYMAHFNKFTRKFGRQTPSFFDVDEAFRGQIIARRRLAQRALEAQGMPPQQAAQQAMGMRIDQLPVSHWYDNMILGLQDAVRQGVDPIAARATFDAFNLVSASMSPKNQVSGQVTKALNIWENLIRGIPVEQAVTGHTQNILSPVKRWAQNFGQALESQKAGSFHWGMSGDRNLFTFDSMELRRLFHQYLGDAMGVDVRSQSFLRRMANHFGQYDKAVTIKGQQVVVTPQAIKNGTIRFEHLSDLLYGDISGSGRYSLITAPHIEAAGMQGLKAAQGQSTTWVGWAPETGVANVDEIFDLITNNMQQRGYGWKELLTGQMKLADVAGPAVALHLAALLFFEELEMDWREVVGQDMNAVEGREPFMPGGLTAEELNELARSGGQ
jgi:hypothetical protein